MTHTELLELAGKAIGIKKDDSPYNGGGIGNTGFDMLGNMVTDWHNGKRWNPRTDDGDALRLAVYLEFEIDITSTGVAVRTRCGLKVLVNKTEEPDLCAAARLAITRAAAEIGRKMEEQS